jgi:hypothetical protein
LLYALTEQGLEIYSKQLVRTGTVEMPGNRKVARVGGKLALGGRDGLSIYDLREIFQPVCDTVSDCLDGMRVERFVTREQNRLLALMEDGTAKSIQWTENGLQETATYGQIPWFAESIRLGTLVVMPGKDRTRLELYRYGATNVI